jgi:hypothetical protein
MAIRITLLAIGALLVAAPGTALAQRLQLDSLNRLADRAEESVNIDLEPALLRFALPFLSGQGDEKVIKAMLSELKGIYVRVYEFNQDVDTSTEVNAIRKQLTAPWIRLVGVDSKRDRELVEIYSWREGDASGGLAIIAAERNELTVVNIVGPFDIAKLAALKGLGVPDLPR